MHHIFLVSLFLIVVVGCLGQNATESIKYHVRLINDNIDLLQLKSSEVLYGQITAMIGSRFFPIEFFPSSLSRTSKNAELAIIKVSSRCNAIRDEWNKVNETILKYLVEKKFLFANILIQEIRESFAHVTSQRDDFIKTKDSLQELLIKSYQPKDMIEMLLDDSSIYIDICVYTLCLVIPFLVLWPMKRRGCIVLYFILAIVLTGSLALLFTSFISQVRLRFGVPEPIAEARSCLYRLKPYWHGFEYSYGRINESIQWLVDYSDTEQLVNETVLSGIMDFSKKVTEITSHQVTDPEAALQLVTHSREKIETQKKILIKLSSGKSIKNKKTELDNLLLFLNYFEVFFSQTEVAIYANLKAGYDMNVFFSDNMDIMLGHIKDGNLLSCVTILSELHRQQLSQLAKLNASNTFIAKTNDAISQIRQESTRLQPSLESEEMSAWIKEMGSKASMTLTTLPAIAFMALPAVAALPVAATGAAIALVGYNWAGFYNTAQKECREIIKELGSLDEVLRKTEEGLTSHEKTLTILMEDIYSVIRHINQSEIRFRHINVKRIFSQTEIDLLTTGVNRVKDSIKTLTDRYKISMTLLFNSIMSRHESIQLGNGDGNLIENPGNNHLKQIDATPAKQNNDIVDKGTHIPK